MKVGHAGTLDPFASGLLLILVGRASRAQRFVMELPKTYEVVARFGAVSSTGDPEGEITTTGAVPQGDLELPTGKVLQRPPVYSAVKIAGQRAYKLARAGVKVDMPQREVVVYAFEERRREGDRRAFHIECSSGTYVRSLIADLGDAYCEELRRTRIGPFEVHDADVERIVPLNTALSFIPEVVLGEEDARKASHGVAVEAGRGRAAKVPGSPEGAQPPPGAAPQSSSGCEQPSPGAAHPPSGVPGVVRLIDEHGLIALARPIEGGRLKPIVGFRG